MEFSEPRNCPRDPKFIGMRYNTAAYRSRLSTKLQDKFTSDNPTLSYADFDHQIARSAGNYLPKSSGIQQSCAVEVKAKEDELVKYMSNVPSYLEKGKSFQEKPLSIGVLDWRHLEKWKYNNDPLSQRTSYFSSEGSSSHSNRVQSSSPARQSMNCSSLQSHLEASPVKTYSQDKCYSGRHYSSSPDRQRTYHLVPHSHHQKVYPWESHSLNVGRTTTNTDKFKEKSPSSSNYRITQKNSVVGMDRTSQRDQSGGRLEMFDINADVASSSKGKLKIRECELKDAMQSRLLNQDHHSDCAKEPNTVVLMVPRNQPFNRGSTKLPDSSVSVNLIPRECEGRKNVSKMDNYKEGHGSDLSSCSQNLQDHSNRRIEMKSLARSRNTEERKSIAVLKTPLDKRTSSESVTTRHSSPIRRFGSAMGSIIRSAGSRDNSPMRGSCSKDSITRPGLERVAVSAFSDTDKSPASCRARSSPLKRLLDPLIKSKTPNVRDSVELLRKDSGATARSWKSSDEQLEPLKAKSLKVKSTITSGKTMCAKDSHQNVKKGCTPIHALLQVAVKNGLPLFTFAVDNDNDILAATLRNLSTAGRNRSGWIYTFFTVHEMKKKNSLWLNQGSKGNGNFVPNVIAQMKVSDCQTHGRIRQKGAYGCSLREFTLFSVDVGQIDQNATEFQPTDELAAIVAKLPKPTIGSLSSLPIDPSQRSSQGDSSNTQGCTSHIPLSTTLILPGGVHTVPSKGSISTLTQRWRSGGACDCGGWDLGCQLRVLTNQGESQKLLTSSKTWNASEEFKLFSQVGEESELVLSLNPFKERIYSVEFDSSLSLLQAFATCVALLDCKRPSGVISSSNVAEGISSRARSSVSNDLARMKPGNQSHGQAPASYVSYPPHSPVGRV